jgi:hypothetical protein
VRRHSSIKVVLRVPVRLPSTAMEAPMPAPRRHKLIVVVASILVVLAWISVLPGLMSASNALWVTLAIGLIGFVSVRFRRHNEVPDSMHLT